MPTVPTIQQLTEYSAALPDIYQDILRAFPRLEPQRKAGDGLALSSLASYLSDKPYSYDFDQVREASRKLADSGFVEMKHGLFISPTAVGEQLIGVVTGEWAEKRTVPELPTPTW